MTSYFASSHTSESVVKNLNPESDPKLIWYQGGSGTVRKAVLSRTLF